MSLRSRRCHAAFFAALTTLVIGPAISASVLAAPPSVEAKKGELQDLQTRIESLSREIAQTEASRSFAVDQLRETESAVSGAARQLRQLGTEKAQLTGQISDLEVQNKRLDQQTLAHQTQLARLMNRQFIGGDSDALKLVLSGRDPNQAARDQYFLTQLSRAKADIIKQIKAITEEKARLANTMRERQSQLAENEKLHQESHAQLLARKKQREATLAKIADRIKSQQREVETLKLDEQRLGKLIEGLARIAAAKKRAAAAKTEERKRKPETRRGKPGKNSTESAIPDHDPGQVGGEFAQLRGKLKLPVRGSITGRFGKPRAEGGASWKGVFIRASEGAEVRTVAPGTVVFSDWVRGFGNLLIVDHGDDFMSVYGNNESLLATVGATVKSNETIATVGNSGGNPDSGLYFELRHQGQPFDPLKWASAR